MICEEDWSKYLVDVEKLEGRKRKIFTQKAISVNKIISKRETSSRFLDESSGLVNNYTKENKDLKRGSFRIDKTIDLHGMTKVQARDALINFVNEEFIKGNKNLLIITGKGKKLAQDIGVIRKNLPLWLDEVNLSKKISSYSYAKNKDGGEGAFYVRLKSNI